MTGPDCAGSPAWATFKTLWLGLLSSFKAWLIPSRGWHVNGKPWLVSNAVHLVCSSPTYFITSCIAIWSICIPLLKVGLDSHGILFTQTLATLSMWEYKILGHSWTSCTIHVIVNFVGSQGYFHNSLEKPQNLLVQAFTARRTCQFQGRVVVMHDTLPEHKNRFCSDTALSLCDVLCLVSSLMSRQHI